ncbi:hypothetical protein [Bifidobacterium sp. AGR2158]|uniref:hypothetical protein n=1 Tax=Bifidobacterium sp. AGR2158 TaxID=1280675 RepID=UPI0018CB13CC|nr:hypothetical protein [Bifidobacterium sp. AGR2158]
MSPVQALKALWQKHAGVPEDGTEDAGRWEVLRRAAAAQGEGVAFDEWVLEQEARLDERGMLIDIRNAERRQAAALEQLAEAVEAQRLNHVASLTVGELMTALKPLTADTADAADVWADYVELDDETHENPEAGRVDHLTVLFDDGGLRGTVTTWAEDDTTAFYLMGDGDAIMMPNPDALHDLADRYRTVYAAALDHVADLWEARRDAGDIPTAESRR